MIRMAILTGEMSIRSRIFAALLAWYECTEEQKYLDAVVRAVDLSIDRYSDVSSFDIPAGDDGKKKGYGGAYLKRGPLLFGLSFPHTMQRLKEH